MKKHLANLSKNSWVQGGFLLTASNLLVGFINYIFNILVGRALGPQGLGEIAALFAYLVVFSIPIGALSSLLIQKIGSARDPLEYASGIGTWIGMKFRSWWYFGILLLVLTPFVPSLTNLTPISGYLLPIFIILSFVSAYYTGAIQGLHLFFWFSCISIVTVGIKLAGALLVNYGIGGLPAILGFILFSSVLGLIMNHVIFVRKVKSYKHVPIIPDRRIRDIFKDHQLWLATGVTSALALVNNVDIIYVKKFFDAETAGFYSVWSLFAKIIFYLLSPLVTLAFIFFSDKRHELRHQIVLIISFMLLIGMGVIANIGYSVKGMFLVRSLFGAAFTSIVPYIEWAAYFGTGYTLMAYLMYYFLAKKSWLSTTPIMLFPFLVLALFMWGTGIEKVMYICTIFTYCNIGIFLGAFFKERLRYLLS